MSTMSSREAVGSSLFQATPKPDPEIDAPHRLQFEGPVRQTLGPFRRKPMPRPAETSE